MAHFPRWISSPIVDSQAMLNAFIHWYSSAVLEDRIRVHELYTIDHSTFPMSGMSVVQPCMADGHVIPSRPCTESNCRRCSTGSGGYKFLWYDSSLLGCLCRTFLGSSKVVCSLASSMEKFMLVSLTSTSPSSAEQPMKSFLVDDVRLITGDEAKALKGLLPKIITFGALAGQVGSQKRSRDTPWTPQANPLSQASKCRCLGRSPTGDGTVPDYKSP